MSATASWAISLNWSWIHYEVVWRDSTSPVWTDYESFPVGDEGVVVDLSKDNNMVGVRAVDEDGNKSPVALAR